MFVGFLLPPTERGRALGAADVPLSMTHPVFPEHCDKLRGTPDPGKLRGLRARKGDVLFCLLSVGQDFLPAGSGHWSRAWRGPLVLPAGAHAACAMGVGGCRELSPAPPHALALCSEWEQPPRPCAGVPIAIPHSAPQPGPALPCEMPQLHTRSRERRAQLAALAEPRPRIMTSFVKDIFQKNAAISDGEIRLSFKVI